MFVLAEIKDTIRIPPTKFGQDLNDAIANELNKKLANKVVFNVGLCIALHDITEIGDSHILPGDGASHTPVSMEFFDDITIPYEYLQQPSKFDEEEQLWVWEYETEEGTHDLFMDIGEELRFRVIDETFTDMTPAGPENISQEKPTNQESETKRSPYVITGTITEPGLGLLSWWANS